MCLKYKNYIFISLLFGIFRFIRNKYKKLTEYRNNNNYYFITKWFLNMNISLYNAKIYTRILVDNNIKTKEQLNKISISQLNKFFFLEKDFIKISKFIS